MWFVLRMIFWLGVVLVLLPNVGWQPPPKSQISASQALLAAKDIVAEIQHFCERQPEACVAGSQATVTLGQRAQVGANWCGSRPAAPRRQPGRSGPAISSVARP